MRDLQPEHVNYLVVHTAASRLKNLDAGVIDGWHRERGFDQIGYHYVILNDLHDEKADGTVEPGRPVDKQGAHARGINSRSIGICCIGHGDEQTFTPAQTSSLTRLLGELATRYDIPNANIIGHREINELIRRGLVSDAYRTDKSCPGRLIDMHDVRRLVEQRLAPPVPAPAETDPATAAQIRDAVAALDANQAHFPNARDEWKAFRTHPEIQQFLSDS